MKRLVFNLALPLLLVATPALAQTRPPEIPWDPVAPPRPFVMADLSATRLLGASVGWGVIGDGTVDAYMVDVTGEYALSPSVKLTGRLPMVAAQFDSILLPDDDGAAIGNVQLGGRVISALGGGAHVGGTVQVSLPTGPSFDFGDMDAVAAAAATTLHFTDDLGRYIGEILTIRVGGDLRLVRGKGFVQLGAAWDAHEYVGDQDPDDEQINYLHLFAGGGAFLTPKLAAMAELATWADAFGEVDGGEDFRHSLVLGLRYEASGASIGGRFDIFLDEDARDDGQRIFTLEVLARLP